MSESQLELGSKFIEKYAKGVLEYWTTAGLKLWPVKHGPYVLPHCGKQVMLYLEIIRKACLPTKWSLLAPFEQ